jgi:hypothetical protein
VTLRNVAKMNRGLLGGGTSCLELDGFEAMCADLQCPDHRVQCRGRKTELGGRPLRSGHSAAGFRQGRLNHGFLLSHKLVGDRLAGWLVGKDCHPEQEALVQPERKKFLCYGFL